MRQTHRTAYVALTGILALAGGVAATSGGADAKSVAVGLAHMDPELQDPVFGAGRRSGPITRDSLSDNRPS